MEVREMKDVERLYVRTMSKIEKEYDFAQEEINHINSDECMIDPEDIPEAINDVLDYFESSAYELIRNADTKVGKFIARSALDPEIAQMAYEIKNRLCRKPTHRLVDILDNRYRTYAE